MLAVEYGEIIMNIFPFLLDEKFDEGEFISQCMRGFAEIRNQYNIDKEKIERIRGNARLERLATDILDGFIEKGIIKLAQEIPGWENRYFGTGSSGFFGGPIAWCVDPMKFNKNDNQTEYWIRKMMQLYEEKCKLLCHALSLN